MACSPPDRLHHSPAFVHRVIRDQSATDRLTVTGAGALAVNAAGTASIQATAAVTLSSSGAAASVISAQDVTLAATSGTLTLTGATGVTINTGAATGAVAGAVSIRAATTATTGSHVTITGGATTGGSHVGGAVSISGGAVTGGSSTGGDVVIAGGVGTSAGGNVEVRAGAGGTDGLIKLADGTGTSRVEVTATGTVNLKGDTTFEEGIITQKRIAWSGVYSVAAAATLSWDAADYAVVLITSDSTVDNNDITVTGTPIDGQMITIINQDEQATQGDIVVPSGETKLVVYYSGTWYA